MKHVTLFRVALVASMAAVFVVPSVSLAAVCTQISADIGTGSSDSYGSQNVISLQRFLVSEKYVAAVPNGYFGPSTTMGVKMFQAARGISATGFVGPLTRAAIEAASCSASTANPSTSSDSQAAPILKNPSSSIFSSPKAGESLAIGATHKISWKAPSTGSYSLVLDNATSTARGVIEYFSPDSGKKTWDVGSVTVGSNKETVEPGMYRFRLQDRAQGPMASDQVSNWFEITAPAASIKSMMPSVAVADGKTAVVMYGSGFTQGTSLYVYDSYKKWVNILFVSADTSVIVFSVPADINAGTYDLIITDTYGAISTGPRITIKKP